MVVGVSEEVMFLKGKHNSECFVQVIKVIRFNCGLQKKLWLSNNRFISLPTLAEKFSLINQMNYLTNVHIFIKRIIRYNRRIENFKAIKLYTILFMTPDIKRTDENVFLLLSFVFLLRVLGVENNRIGLEE